MASVCVYELVDPTTDKVFYVGKGRRSRPRTHITFAKRWIKTGKTPSPSENFHKLGVIRRLLLSGQEPVVHFVRWFEEDTSALLFERDLIAHYGLTNLTNFEEGGEEPWLDAARRKISLGNKGKKRSDETKKRMSEAQRGHPVSSAAKEKMRAAKLGKKQKPEHIASNVTANIGRAKRPTVSRTCRECGQEAPHRQRLVNGGKSWVKPRCMTCEYKNHKSYIARKMSVACG